MKITLITVGKIKERFFEAAIEEYSKRLSRYCKLEIIQVADEKTPDGASEALERQIREKEGERILSHIRDGAYVIALAIRGKEISSEELAAKIARLAVEGKGQLVFIIGGPYGFSEKVYQVANEKISMSKMTFSHQMIRLIFVEQIYRAMTILNGGPYHHE